MQVLIARPLAEFPVADLGDKTPGDRCGKQEKWEGREREGVILGAVSIKGPLSYLM